MSSWTQGAAAGPEHGLNGRGGSPGGQGAWLVVEGPRRARRGGRLRAPRGGGPRPARGRPHGDDGRRRHRRPRGGRPGPGHARSPPWSSTSGCPTPTAATSARRCGRAGIDVPVLFLTARDQLHDVLAGFAAGGDDHLAKPFHVSELLARRAGAMVRRGRPARPPCRPGCTSTRPTTRWPGPAGPQPLTPTEFRLLAALMAPPGRWSGGATSCRAAWPDGALVADNTLDQYVARLRRKVTRGRGRRPADRHRARRRLPVHVTARVTAGRSLRSRLAWSASAVVALWLVVLTVGANLLLAGRAGPPGRRRAPGPRRGHRGDGAGRRRTARVVVSDARDDQALDVGTWIFAADGSDGGAAGREQRRGSTGRPPSWPGAAAGTRRPEFADPLRLLALPVSDGGEQLATVVTSTSLAPYRQVERLAWIGSAAARRAAAGRRPPGAAGQRGPRRCGRCSR